jgi:hypothetical protein
VRSVELHILIIDLIDRSYSNLTNHKNLAFALESLEVRAILERIFEPTALDELFERTAEKQYTRDLLFSTIVGLMGLVVSGIHPSVNAAYKAMEKVIGVSRPALYAKLNGLEPQISQALVRLVIRLEKPTRHGDTEVAILTNLPITVSDGAMVAMLYLKRWTVEGLFQVVTDSFHCEIKTLGYPRAALFVFCMALVSFNILSTVKSALKVVHGIEKIEAGLSDYYLVEEVQGSFRGMMIALPAPVWSPFIQMSPGQFALTLQDWAAFVNLKRFSSSPRGPKKPKAKPAYDPKHPHIATAKLLENKNKNKSSS